MKWTPLRTAIRARFADSIADRLDIHQARYRRTRSTSMRMRQQWLTFGAQASTMTTRR